MPTTSKAYEDAVAALRKISLSERFSAFRETVSKEMRHDADVKLGPLVTGVKSWRKLLGKPGEASDALPGDDHTELRRGNTTVYISQPYQLHLDQLRDIVQICDDNKLEFIISAKSWYRPGGTINVTYAAKGDLLKLQW